VALERLEDTMRLKDGAVVERQGDLAVAAAGGGSRRVDQTTEVRVVTSLAVLADHGRDGVANRMG